MMVRPLVIAALLAASSCSAFEKFTAAVNQSDRNMKFVETVDDVWYGVWGNAGPKAERGSLHPALVEYVFAQPGGPFYRSLEYAAALEASPPDRKSLGGQARAQVKESVALVKSMRAQAGAGATMVDLSRAFGRKLAPSVAKATGLSGDGEGTAHVTWGIVPRHKATASGVRVVPEQLACRLSRYEQARIVLLGCVWNDHESVWAWDLRFVPAAFDANAVLTYADIAAVAIPLHDIPEGKRL